MPRNAMVFDEDGQREPITGLFFGIECCVDAPMTITARSSHSVWAESKVQVRCTNCGHEHLVTCSMVKSATHAAVVKVAHRARRREVA